MQRALAVTLLIVLCCAACATVKKTPADARLLEAQTAFDEARKLMEAGQYVEARPRVERALELRETALGQTHPEVASCLDLLGLVHARLGNFTRGEQLLQRAIELREEALGKTHPDVAASLHHLALTIHLQRHYDRAEPVYERSLAIREAALGKNHPLVAHSLNNLALISADRGYFAQAESLYERSLAIREAVLGKDHPDVAHSLNNLACVYMNQGAHARAEPLFKQAIAIREAALGKNHPFVAASMSNLATIYLYQGQYSQAELLYKQALAIRRAALGEMSEETASSLNKLAILYYEQEDYTQAQILQEQALAIEEKVLPQDHPRISDSLSMLAQIYKYQGQPARGEPLLARAIAIVERVHGRKHHMLANHLGFLADLHLVQHQLEETLSLLERAFVISEEHLRQEVFGLSEARLSSFLHNLLASEERLYALARAYPNHPRVQRLALTAALLRKGRSIEELADTSRIVYRSLGESDRESFERLRALRTQIATLALAGPGQLAPADHRQRLEQLTVQADSLELTFARRSAPLRALHALPPPSELLTHVTANLPQDGVLVEFVAYHDRPLDSLLRFNFHMSRGELRYLAFLLFADGRIHILDLGPAAPLDAAAQRLRDTLSRREQKHLPTAQQLHALIFRPLVPHLGKARRLFLAPDGQLAFVPFAALHDGRSFLVETWDMSYLTSGKDLLRQPENNPSAGAVVVLADPDFNASPSPAGLATQNLTAERSVSLARFFATLRAERVGQGLLPLPGTRQEAESIQRLLPQAQLLLGPSATKKALLELETPRVLHIATHGFFLPDASASTATRAVVQPGLPGTGAPQNPDDPLLRSGLVLAGAGTAGSLSDAPSGEDSLVTALELAGLNLWGTQLVVLSACDTGRGDVKLGQGVYGLRRAFMVAGAETVVTSLWKVNDETTSELMTGYYRHLLAGQGRTTALRQAMKELRKKKPHPYYWAPFIAIGQDAPLRGLGSSTKARPVP